MRTSRHKHLRAGRMGSRWLPQAPPKVEAGAGSGGRDPHADLKARRLLRHHV